MVIYLNRCTKENICLVSYSFFSVPAKVEKHGAWHHLKTVGSLQHLACQVSEHFKSYVYLLLSSYIENDQGYE